MRTACCHLPGFLSVRWMHPAQQQGRLRPSRSSSTVRLIRRVRVFCCLASSTQQMNSFRPIGVRFSQSTAKSSVSARASFRSSGISWTSPPESRCVIGSICHICPARSPSSGRCLSVDAQGFQSLRGSQRTRRFGHCRDWGADCLSTDVPYASGSTS